MRIFIYLFTLVLLNFSCKTSKESIVRSYKQNFDNGEYIRLDILRDSFKLTLVSDIGSTHYFGLCEFNKRRLSLIQNIDNTPKLDTNRILRKNVPLQNYSIIQVFLNDSSGSIGQSIQINDSSKTFITDPNGIVQYKYPIKKFCIISYHKYPLCYIANDFDKINYFGVFFEEAYQNVLPASLRVFMLRKGNLYQNEKKGFILKIDNS